MEPAQGTALYALQSCANHSCCPSALPYKSELEVDGAAVLVAQRDIAPGEEVCSPDGIFFFVLMAANSTCNDHR